MKSLSLLHANLISWIRVILASRSNLIIIFVEIILHDDDSKPNNDGRDLLFSSKKDGIVKSCGLSGSITNILSQKSVNYIQNLDKSFVLFLFQLLLQIRFISKVFWKFLVLNILSVFYKRKLKLKKLFPT